ncbi:MAG: hypothetical protein ACK56K_00320, partial [Akkermansiaceae bacterium]
MFPRGIPSAALPAAVTSPLRHAAPAPARFQARYHSHPPATSTPHGQAVGGSRPPGSAPLHRRPPRRPPPAAKKLRAPACGIMFVPHIMPPAPQDSRREASEERFGKVVRAIHIGGSRGHLRALRRQVLLWGFMSSFHVIFVSGFAAGFCWPARESGMASVPISYPHVIEICSDE